MRFRRTPCADFSSLGDLGAAEAEVDERSGDGDRRIRGVVGLGDHEGGARGALAVSQVTSTWPFITICIAPKP